MSAYRTLTDAEKEATAAARIRLAGYLAENMPELSWPEHRLQLGEKRNPVVAAYQLLAGLDPDGLCVVHTQRCVAIDVDSGEPHLDLIVRPPAEPEFVSEEAALAAKKRSNLGDV